MSDMHPDDLIVAKRLSGEDDGMYEVPGSRLQELRDKERIADALGDAEHEHNWEVNGVNWPVPTIFKMGTYTNVLLRCIVCRWLCSLELVGHWSEEQIKGEADASSNTTADQAPTTSDSAGSHPEA